MDKVFEKLKNLFKGESQLKRHGMLLLLLLLPSIAGGVAGVIDKDVPKEILFPLLFIAVILLLLSIIPGLFLLGYTADFYIMKRKGIPGLPAINADTLMKGLKLFPLVLVWSLYALILFSVIFIIPLICLVASIFGASASPDNPIGFILAIIALIVLYFISLIVFVILAPFFVYVYFSFIEDFEYRAEYFNPFIIISYMKTVFKETMITMLKYLLVSMIACTAVSVVVFILGFAIGLLAVLPAAMLEEPASTIAAMVVIVPLSALCTIIQTYVTTLIGFAAGDAYMDIYKEHIRIPDPLEAQQAQQSDTPDDGWSGQKI